MDANASGINLTCARLSLFWAAALGAAACRADLVHHYTFTLDAADVVGGADGTLLGGAAVLGGALTLDGTND